MQLSPTPQSSAPIDDVSRSSGSVFSRRPKRHVDAWDFLVWAVRDQRADQDDVGLHEIELQSFAQSYWRTSTCGCSAIGRIGAIGTPIDGGGHTRGVAPSVHPDADRAVETLRGIARSSFVLRHARVGDPPSWSDGTQRLVPAVNPDGGGRRYRVLATWQNDLSLSGLVKAGFRLVDRTGTRRFKDTYPGFEYRLVDENVGREVKVRYCPIHQEPSTEWISSVNNQYSRWHEVMTAFCERIRDASLRDHVVTGFRHPAAPWSCVKTC